MAKKSVNISRQERQALTRFGGNVRGIREQKKLSVYDVTGEDMLIKDRQHWQRIENGQKNITLVTVVRVAKALGVSPEVLLKGV